MLYFSRQPHSGERFWKKNHRIPKYWEKKKKTYLAFCQYFKGDRKNELYLLE